MRPRRLLVVTGIGRHSLGEAVVREYLRAGGRTIAGLDRVKNDTLDLASGYTGVQIDLDPLSTTVGSFTTELLEALKQALPSSDGDGVDTLIQGAGVYAAGSLANADPSLPRKVLGTNFLGHVELLRAVLVLNEARGIANASELTYIEVGSSQGLTPRANRSLYASSKAAGLDFAVALSRGRELARCLYFAAGPIDTRMLHRNHWCYKAGATTESFESLAGSDSETYEAIFVRCDRAVYDHAMSHLGTSPEIAADWFDRYTASRREAFDADLGVLAAAQAARMLMSLAEDSAKQSGVYLAAAPAAIPQLTWIDFSRLDRLGLLITSGTPVEW